MPKDLLNPVHQQSTKSIIAEKVVHSGALHMMISKGGVLPIGDLFGIEFGNCGDKFTGVRIVTFGLNSKISYRVNQTTPKPKKPKIRQISEFKAESEELFK